MVVVVVVEVLEVPELVVVDVVDDPKLALIAEISGQLFPPQVFLQNGIR